jgi:hypothetical protein
MISAGAASQHGWGAIWAITAAIDEITLTISASGFLGIFGRAARAEEAKEDRARAGAAAAPKAVIPARSVPQRHCCRSARGRSGAGDGCGRGATWGMMRGADRARAGAAHGGKEIIMMEFARSTPGRLLITSVGIALTFSGAAIVAGGAYEGPLFSLGFLSAAVLGIFGVAIGTIEEKHYLELFLSIIALPVLLFSFAPLATVFAKNHATTPAYVFILLGLVTLGAAAMNKNEGASSSAH